MNTEPRYTQVTLNGRDDEPSQEQLEVIWKLLEAGAEDGWLRVDQDGNSQEEVDEDDLASLLMSDMKAAGEMFGYYRQYHAGSTVIAFNLPAYLCGTYTIHRVYSDQPTYFFAQWGI